MIDVKEDYSQLIADIKVELRRLGESLNSDRVRQWCHNAGYGSVHHLDKKGLTALKTVLQGTK